MTIYKNRYQAKKHAKSNEVIVKVEGGYAIMDAAYYNVWKKQK